MPKHRERHIKKFWNTYREHKNESIGGEWCDGECKIRNIYARNDKYNSITICEAIRSNQGTYNVTVL